MNNEFLNLIATNGPWAVVACFLLLKVIDAWTKDRSQLTLLLTEFKDAIVGLKDAVQTLNQRQ